MSCEEGALLEPLSVAVNACKRAQVKMGDHILVCGAGKTTLLLFILLNSAKSTLTDRQLEIFSNTYIEVLTNVPQNNIIKFTKGFRKFSV